MGTNKRPIAVLISDVHYSLNTLELADASMRQAIKHANNLDTPLIICGDLHDTKAILRAECVNRMLETFSLANSPPLVLVGNHDKVNEKSEEHSLNFLQGLAQIIEVPTLHYYKDVAVGFIPYMFDPQQAVNALNNPADIYIMHQGVHGADMGEYVQDKSAISIEAASGKRVISGHYHTRQTIEAPNNGSFTYVGNPYTLTFGEANDPEKGFQVLYSDGSLEFIPTNLRKHVKLELTTKDLKSRIVANINTDDLVWVKVNGPSEELALVNKAVVANCLGLTQGFKLDLITTDETAADMQPETKSQSELLDEAIQGLNCSEEQKQRLKDLWRELF